MEIMAELSDIELDQAHGGNAFARFLLTNSGSGPSTATILSNLTVSTTTIPSTSGSSKYGLWVGKLLVIFDLNVAAAVAVVRRSLKTPRPSPAEKIPKYVAIQTLAPISKPPLSEEECT